MTLVVPFDGSPLAEAALVRASEFSSVLNERVLAISVIPTGNRKYAEEREWLHAAEEYDVETIVGRLHTQVTDLCPSADFRHLTVGRAAAPGRIASRTKEAAKANDASMVFVGSENAGHLAATISSVGSTIVAADAYDVVIVRHRSPAKSETLRRESPHRKSGFYQTG